MIPYYLSVIIMIFFVSCNAKDHFVVDKYLIDSIINGKNISRLRKINNEALLFAKLRLDTFPGGLVDAEKYAAALAQRFHLNGEISALRSADSIMQWINIQNVERDAGILRTLAFYAILQHRFSLANDYIQKALGLGSEKYISELIHFDIAIERGHYSLSKNILERLKSTNDFGYFYRLSRYEHWRGEMHNSIKAMYKASELAGNNTGLKQAAISNLGSLYLHNAEVQKANDLYMQSIRLDNSDIHSLMKLGLIALHYEKNNSLAEKIFQFARSNTYSPEPILNLAYVAQQSKDTTREKKYAREFLQKVNDSIYGNMYNKYKVDIFTTLLNQPGYAVIIAEKEIENRATPQTFAWLAWSLFKNGEKERGLKIFEEHVSGKQLEGLELYYMGMMMKEMKQGFNAEQYLKSAWQNRYDLSPSKIMQLKLILNTRN